MTAAQAGHRNGHPRTITKAQQRAMRKAIAKGRVMIAGGFGGSLAPREAIAHPEYDRREPVERLIARGFLAPATGANSYAVTELGRAMWRALHAARRAAAAYQEGRHAEAAPAQPKRPARPAHGAQARAGSPGRPRGARTAARLV